MKLHLINKSFKNDTNAVPQTPPSPSVSPISRMSKSPSVTQPNDFKCRTPETDQDMDSIVALRSEFPTLSSQILSEIPLTLSKVRGFVIKNDITLQC